MTRRGSSSFTQTRKDFWSLCQMPLPSGQSRAIPAQVSRGDTGLSNKKWSLMSWSCSASVIPFRGYYFPLNSPSREARASMDSFSMALRSPRLLWGGQGVSLDGASGTHTAGQHVGGVQVISTLQVLEVEVGGVLVGGLVSAVTV